jgi:hypothetical protein
MAYLIDLWQFLDFWSMKYSQSQADHLQILASGGSTDISRLGPYIVDDTLLQPWNEEMCAFIDDRFLHARQPVEDDGSSATLDIVYSSLTERKGYADRDCPSRDSVQRSRHDERAE